jgi:hypothetical protein
VDVSTVPHTKHGSAARARAHAASERKLIARRRLPHAWLRVRQSGHRFCRWCPAWTSHTPSSRAATSPCCTSGLGTVVRPRVSPARDRAAFARRLGPGRVASGTRSSLAPQHSCVPRVAASASRPLATTFASGSCLRARLCRRRGTRPTNAARLRGPLGPSGPTGPKETPRAQLTASGHTMRDPTRLWTVEQPAGGDRGEKWAAALRDGGRTVAAVKQPFIYRKPAAARGVPEGGARHAGPRPSELPALTPPDIAGCFASAPRT